jgi:uncharacterized membrane protein
MRSIWFDEAFSWRLIQFPFSEMIARAAQDVHPPLYYILLNAWATVFGSSIVALRSFSIACFLGVLIGAYLFASYAFQSKRAGWLSVFLLGLSGWALSYAGEARMYTLGMALTLFSSWALLVAVRKHSYLWFVLYALFGLALVLTHYYGFFTIAAHACFVLGWLVSETRGRVGEILQEKVWWASITALGIIFLGFLPWAPAFLHQLSQVRQAYWVPELSWRSVPETFYQFFIPSVSIPSSTLYERILLFIPEVLVVLLWLSLVLVHPKRRIHDGIYLTLLLNVLPIVFSILISFSGRSLYDKRFFAFAGIFIFIGIAYLLDSIRWKNPRRILIGIVLFLLCISTLRYWKQMNLSQNTGVHAAVEYIFSNKGDHDPVIVSSPYIYFPVAHYAHEQFGKAEAVNLYSASGELSHFSGAPIATIADIAVPEDVASYKGTVWVVDTTGFTEKPFESPKNWHEQSREMFSEVFVYQGDVIVRKFLVQ